MSCDSANDRAAPRFRLSSLSANGPFKKPAVLLAAAALLASPVVSAQEKTEKVLLAKAAAEAEQQQRHLAIGNGLLRQIVIHDHGVHAVVAAISIGRAHV